MHICFDGKILKSGEPVLSADDKSYRYGDGLFETIKMVKGQMPLFDLHMNRLFSSMQLLEFSPPALFTPEKLKTDIISVCNKNNCTDLARIRLSVSRGNGGIYEYDRDRIHCLIESWPGNPSYNQLNENGLVVGVFPHARKSMDLFSRLKSANYLPYTMAARFAKQQQWNDCLLLNTDGAIADASIANLFLVDGDEIITPAIGQGGVEGVMRRYLIDKMRESGFAVEERAVFVNDAAGAEEMFLTNAMNGIRWVGRFENKILKNNKTRSLYHQFIETLWS
ncbi:aminotransferase class IV [Terrimonas sp. NA20]|uniref:branched-chain-amino-acid transaminase n=1 Tax=Terrimonas ginsenosidimutans TaxID=2908004 RepID=A0ABS9KPC9_9BACT|nr:aminotransferase class IV [Terrimonas ginsenosidimutans]MCG2614182.1 aminotransferase class IV [Terrimonas ginsenosidimutans]